MKTGNFNINNLIQGFILSCQAEAKSPKTIEWYSSFLNRFSRFLKQSDMPDDATLIDKHHIRAFIRYLQTEAKTPRANKPLSPTTVSGYVRTLKAFFSWLEREEYVASNPMHNIPVPKSPVKIIEAFNTEQITKLIDTCRRSDGHSCRDLTIILLMLDTGLRVSEVVTATADDLNLDEGYVIIRSGKGGKGRVVPLGSLLQKLLWKYLHYFRPQPLTNRITRLFLNDKGIPLTKNGIQQMVRRYGKRACLTGVRCSPHTFRHTFAKNYLLNGGDIFSLQKILGHSSLASVRMYLNLFADDVKKQHQRFSPVDTLAETSNLYSIIRIPNNEG